MEKNLINLKSTKWMGIVMYVCAALTLILGITHTSQYFDSYFNVFIYIHLFIEVLWMVAAGRYFTLLKTQKIKNDALLCAPLFLMTIESFYYTISDFIHFLGGPLLIIWELLLTAFSIPVFMVTIFAIIKRYPKKLTLAAAVLLTIFYIVHISVWIFLLGVFQNIIFVTLSMIVYGVSYAVLSIYLFSKIKIKSSSSGQEPRKQKTTFALQTLQQALDSGAITREEYDRKRREILEKL